MKCPHCGNGLEIVAVPVEENKSEFETLRYIIDDKQAGWLKGNTNRQILTRLLDYLIRKEGEK